MLKQLKKIPILLLAYILSIQCSFAQVTYDDNGISGSGFSLSRDISIPGGSNRLLVVHISNLDNTPNDRSSIPSIPTASFDGQEMTQVITEGSSFGRSRSSIFIFKLGTGCELSGQINLDGGFRTIWAGSFQHVNQDTPISNQGFADISPNVLTSSINGLTTVAGMDMLFDGILVNDEFGNSPDLAALGDNDIILRLQLGESSNTGTRIRPATGGGETVEWEVSTHTDKIQTAIVLNGVLQTNSAPTALCKTSYEVNLDENGTATITPRDIDNGSFDNCGGVSLSFTGGAQTYELTCGASVLTPENVTLEVLDEAGNLSTCMTSVLAVDNIPPTVECRDRVIRIQENQGVGFSDSHFIANASDNCEVIISRGGTGYGCINEGENIRTITVRDPSGNTASCEAIVTVEVDHNIPPRARCKPTISVNLDENGIAALSPTDLDDGSSDNCGAVSLSFAGGAQTYELTCGSSPLIPEDITLEVRDTGGNLSTCTTSVTPVDTFPPTAQCKSNITAAVDENGEAILNTSELDDGSFDICGEVSFSFPGGAESLTLSCRQQPGAILPQELIVTDASGNTSSCFSFIERIDTIPPVAICKDITVQLDNSGIVSVANQDINDGSYDNCGILIADFADTYNCNDIGEINLNLLVVDPSGNSSSCDAIVTVEDMMAPIAQCKPSVSVIFDENGDGFIDAIDLDNGSYDNCGAVNFSFSEGEENLNLKCRIDFFPGEEVRLDLVVSDGFGNTSMCSSAIEVIDEVPPVFNCLDVTLQLDDNGMASMYPEDFIDGWVDNCNGRILSPIPTYTCNDLGTNIYTLVIEDIGGNRNSCDATVTILSNPNACNALPIAVCQDITVDANTNCEGTAIATDFDGGSSNPNGGDLVLSLDNEGPYPVGVTPVILSVTNDSNETRTCNAIITVEDNTPPTAICKPTVSVISDENGGAILHASDLDDGSSDNCGEVSFIFSDGEETLSMRCRRDEGSIFPQVLVVTDVSGNSSTCTSSIEVIDNIPPVAICEDVTAYLDENDMAIITDHTVGQRSYDNCQILLDGESPTIYSCDDIGENTYILEVNDRAGNTASCEAIVTVQDTVPPTALCQTSYTVFLDENGVAPITPTDLDNGSYDNCGGVSLSFFRGMQSIEFSCRSTVLPQEDVTLVVSDNVGNESYCTVPIVVRDTTPPVAMCKDITVQLDNNGIAFVGSADVNDGSYDNCEFAISNYEFTYLCEDIGTQVITLSITDPSGNTASCDASVTVERNSNACNTAPIAVCQDITVDANENCEGTAIPTDFDGGSSDPDGDDIFFSLGNEGPYPLGVTHVRMKVIDANGVSSDCAASITVEDNTAPTALCKSNMSVVFDESGVATINAADLDDGSFDHCGDVSFSYLGGLESITVGCVGSNFNLELFVTDPSGNTSTCISPIQIEDNIPPVALCKDITVQLDENGVVWVAGQDIDNGSYDNCNFRILNYPMQYTCDDVGTQDYTLMVIDAAFNTASCDASLTITDEISPVLTAPDNGMRNTDPGQTYYTIQGTEFDAIFSDNCSGGSIINDYNGTASLTGEQLGVGTHIITWTATDAAGNTSSATVNITIQQSCDINIANIETMNATDCDFTDGSITITATGTSLEYSIDEGITFQSNHIFSGLSVGSYNIVVREINAPNCYVEDNVIIRQPTYCSCEIFGINVLETSECNPINNTYSQTLEIIYNDILNSGELVVNGQSFSIVESPQTIELTGLVADGQTVDVNVYWSEYADCQLQVPNAFTAPSDCSVPCDIISVVAGDPYNCDPNSDTYECDLTVEYQGTNLTGNFMVSIDGGPSISYPLSNQSPQVITLSDLPSNGQWVDVEVYISEASNCSWVANNFFQNPQDCGTNPGGDCDIISLTVGEQSCNDENNQYQQELIITYTDAPSAGQILLKANNQNGWETFPITGSPQILRLESRPVGEGEIDIFVKFSDDNGCTFSADNLFTAPEECVLPSLPCVITSIATGTQTACDPSTNTYTQELIVIYENEPSNGNLIIGGQVFGITGSPQMITLTNLPADGNDVDVTAYFSEDNTCQLTEDNLFTAPDACTQPPSGDGAILFVVKVANNMHSGDVAVKNQLEGLGYTVIVKGQGPAKTGDADGKVLVLISNTVASTAVNTKFTNVNVPVVTYESQLLDDLGMTGNNNGVDYGQDSNEQTMDIDDASHPMAAGLSGEPQVFSSNGSIIWGKPNDNAVKVSSTQGGFVNQWGIFGYETGASMVNGIAPARRASLFFKANDANKLNTNGWALFDAVICWATGCQNARFAPEVSYIPPVKAYPNPFLNNLTIEWEHHAQEVHLTMRNLLGQQVFTQKVWLEGRFQLSTTNLPEGMYILQVIGDDFKQEVKVMKE